jgi:hypothetical protein
VFQELAKGRLGLEEEAIAPRQGHQPSARDAGGQAAPDFERDTGLVTRMEHECRNAHLQEQRGTSVSPLTSDIRAATSPDTVMRCSLGPAVNQ